MKHPNRSGRQRHFNPSIPSHIDQSKIPTGVYWDNSGRGRWFIQLSVDSGRLQNKRIAGRSATLADLHRLAEEFKGIRRDTLEWLCDQFEASPQFRDLSLATQKDYRYCRAVVCGMQGRDGKPLGESELRRWNPPTVQKLIDRLALEGTPSKANHVLRFLRRLFRWGMVRGFIQRLPTEAVEQARERSRRRLPDESVYCAVLRFAQQSGAIPSHCAGSHPPYLWPIMELAYLCRLRGIEVITLTEAHLLDVGLQTNRRKGSRDNIVAWSPRLRLACDEALRISAAIYQSRGLIEQDNQALRYLFVSSDGHHLRRSTLDTAWQRMITDAISQGVITADQRFSLHDLKRKGITDTPGTRADKQHASGHKNEGMLDIYDHSIPLVPPSSDD